jgi:outer membrane protein OmpA-like peptidoglycan-associated protein
VRGLESQLPELDARQSERGWVLAIAPDLMFDRGESTLKPGGRRALESVARVLRQHPERNILVEGFAADASGDDSARHLSERRAHAVRNALVLAGVDGANIVARGAGPMENGPAARVQIVIAPEPAAAATGGSR